MAESRLLRLRTSLFHPSSGQFNFAVLVSRGQARQSTCLAHRRKGVDGGRFKR